MGGVIEPPRPTAQAELLALPQVPFITAHHFGPGTYVREMTAPAGAFMIGAWHRGPTMNVFVKGRVVVIGPEGEPVELVAPMMFPSGPGRKVGFVTEDVVWLNIWATDERDVAALEAALVDFDREWDAPEELAAIMGHPAVGGALCLSS